MSAPTQAHWAINSVRFRRLFDKRGDHPPISLPFGKSFWRYGYRVHCIEPILPFMHPSFCRRDRPKWHNRVHAAAVRWIAVEERSTRYEFKYDVPLLVNDVVTLEYGQGICGQTLNNPTYLADSQAGCVCGKADERTFCPRCNAVLDVRVRGNVAR